MLSQRPTRFPVQSRHERKEMSVADKCFPCNKTRLCIAGVAVVIILIISLAIAFAVNKVHTEKNLPRAKEKFELPTHYFARRPKGIDLNKDMLYLSDSGEEIGHARECLSCISRWTVYMLNAKKEIAVVVKRKTWSWTDKYDVEEQWTANATSYRIEYSWSGFGLLKEVYVIKDSEGDEIARTDRFRLEFGKTITLKH